MEAVGPVITTMITAIGSYVALQWKHKTNKVELQNERERWRREQESEIVPQLTEQLKQVFDKQSDNQSGRIARLETKLDSVEAENLKLIRELAKHEARLEELERKLTSANKENTLLRGRIKDLEFELAEAKKPRYPRCGECNG